MSYNINSKQTILRLILTLSTAVTIFFGLSIFIYVLVKLVELMSIHWILIGGMLSLVTTISIIKLYAIEYIIPSLNKVDSNKKVVDESPEEEKDVDEEGSDPPL